MTAYTKINWLIRVIALSLSLTLFTGIENYAVAGNKKPVKRKIVKKKVAPKVTNQTKKDIPKPVVDDTPINPKKPKKKSVYQRNKKTKKKIPNYKKPPMKKTKKKKSG
jgi:hypothetical protein